MAIVTYVTFLYPGLLSAEKTTQKVESREISSLLIPKRAFALYFWDRVEESNAPDGEILVSRIKNPSNLYYLGGEVYDLARVKEVLPDETSIIRNMEGNGYKAVVHCPAGNWRPLQDGDVVVPLGDLKFAE